VEDFAECFAYFVLNDRPTSAKLEKDTKITFFYGYPTLVKERELLRKGCASVN
jgi:hypothetical protein